MVTITDKRLVPSIFVGAVGLILLGIGIGGLASLPSLTASSMMGPNMMGMMAGPMMGQGMIGGPTSMAGFGMNDSLLINGYMAMMLAIYFGLIAIGSYVIYRAVAPVIKLST